MPLLVEPYCEKKILLDIAFIICVRVKEKITYIHMYPQVVAGMAFSETCFFVAENAIR